MSSGASETAWRAIPLLSATPTRGGKRSPIKSLNAFGMQCAWTSQIIGPPLVAVRRRSSGSGAGIRYTTKAAHRIPSTAETRQGLYGVPSSPGGPVLPDKTAHAGKFRNIRRNQRRAAAQSLGSDQQIVGADRRSCGLQQGAQIAGRQGILIAEGDDLDIAGQENAQPLGFLAAAPAARDAVPQLVQHDRRDGDRIAPRQGMPQPAAHLRRL